MADDSRVLQNTPATITGAFLDQYGEPAAPSGTVTVAVAAADGSEVIPAGTATSAGAGTGEFTVALTAAQVAELDVYTATWTASSGEVAVSWHEIVAGYYSSVEALRAQSTVLQDHVKYPDAALRVARQLVEEEFEGICGQSFVPRFRRARLEVHSASQLVLPEPRLLRVLSVHGESRDGTLTAMDSSTVAAIRSDEVGVARVAGSWPGPAVIVQWVAGFQRPPPDVLGAYFTRVRDVANRDRRGVPDRASTFTAADNGGTYSLLVPGMRGAVTGIPDVVVVHGRFDVEALIR